MSMVLLDKSPVLAKKPCDHEQVTFLISVFLHVKWMLGRIKWDGIWPDSITFGYYFYYNKRIGLSEMVWSQVISTNKVSP
jgi:hypothetical protein